MATRFGGNHLLVIHVYSHLLEYIFNTVVFYATNKYFIIFIEMDPKYMTILEISGREDFVARPPSYQKIRFRLADDNFIRIFELCLVSYQ